MYIPSATVCNVGTLCLNHKKCWVACDLWSITTQLPPPHEHTQGQRSESPAPRSTSPLVRDPRKRPRELERERDKKREREREESEERERKRRKAVHEEEEGDTMEEAEVLHDFWELAGNMLCALGDFCFVTCSCNILVT